MANDPLAVAAQPDTPNEDEYQAFLSALSETARGRAFLAEHARRSRSEENAMLLSSVQRLEGLVRSQAEAPTPEPVGPSPFDEVRDLLETVRDKQDAFDFGALTAQIGMLADMIEDVHRRIDTLVVPAPVDMPAETAAPVEALAAPADELVVAEEAAFAEAQPAAAKDIATESPAEARATIETAAPEAEGSIESVFDVAPQTRTAELAVTPEPLAAAANGEPALEAEGLVAPLELPAEELAVEASACSVEETAQAEDATSMPEVAWGGANEAAEHDAPASPAPPAGLAISALVESLVVAEPEEPPPEARIIKAGTIPPPPPFSGEDFSAGKRTRVMPPAVDPLADIKALSEEERIALFT